MSVPCFPLSKVYLDLMEENDVCSAAYRSQRYNQKIPVGAQTSQLVPLIIMPMKEGMVYVEVKAAVKNSLLTDGIRKGLRVMVSLSMKWIWSLLYHSTISQQQI